MKNLDIPQSIHKSLMAAFQTDRFVTFKKDRCYGELSDRKMFVIDSDQAQSWLGGQLGIVTDDNLHTIGPFVFWFDWSIELWRVGA